MTMGPEPMTRTDWMEGSFGISRQVSPAPRSAGGSGRGGEEPGVGVVEAPDVPEGVEPAQGPRAGRAREGASSGVEGSRAPLLRPAPAARLEARRRDEGQGVVVQGRGGWTI